MKKNLLVSTLALFVLSASANVSLAASNFGKTIKQDLKQTGQTLKNSVKTDLNNSASEAKKAQKEKIKSDKAAALKDVNEKIKNKKAEINTVKKSNMTLTEQTLRLNKLERELKYLETRRNNIAASYDKRLDALK